MDATGKGRIRVYNCNGNKGVKEVELSKGEWMILLWTHLSIMIS
jgi:hypothetical protein